MSEPRIGRVLVASLHQAIAEVLPDRLEFYENWLSVSGLARRHDRTGAAVRGAELPAHRGRGVRSDHGACRRVRGGLDRQRPVAARAPLHPRAADRRCGRAARCAPRARSSRRPIPGRARSSACSAGRRRSTCADRCSARCAKRLSLPLCGFYASAIARVLQHFSTAAPMRGSTSAAPPAAGRAACCRSSSRGATARRTRCRRVTNIKPTRSCWPALAVCSLIVDRRRADLAAQPAVPRSAPAAPRARRPVREHAARAAPALARRGVGGAARRTSLRARGLGAIAATSACAPSRSCTCRCPASLSHATVIKVGHLVGATEVIVGTFGLEGTTLSVDAHSIRIDVGRLQPEVTEQAPLTDLVRDLRPARRPARAGCGRACRAAGAASTARRVRELHQGAGRREPGRRRRTFLEAAHQESPGYDRARARALGGAHEQAIMLAALAAARAVPPTSPLVVARQFFCRRLAHRAEALRRSLRRVQGAGGRSAAAGDSRGALAAAFNNLGVIQIRRGSTPQTGTADVLSDEGRRCRSGDPDYCSISATPTCSTAITRRRSTGCAKRSGAIPPIPMPITCSRPRCRRRAAASRRRASGNWRAAVVALRRARTARRREKLPVPTGLERLRARARRIRGGLRADQAIVNTAQRDQRELATFHLDRGRRLFEREAGPRSDGRTARAVYLSPYEARRIC